MLVTHNHSAVLNLMCCWNVRHASELSEFCTDQILHKLSHWRSHFSLSWKGGTRGWLGVGGRKGGGCINIDLTAILRVWLSKTVFVIIIDGRSPCLMFPQTFLHMESQPVMENLYVCDPAWQGVPRKREMLNMVLVQRSIRWIFILKDSNQQQEGACRLQPAHN